jgi:hypothetical protein
MAELYAEYRAVLAERGDPPALERLAANEAHRGSPGSIRALLEATGLGVEEMVEDRFVLRFAGGGALLRHPLVRIGFLPAWREVAGPAGEAEVFRRLERRLDARAAAGSLDLQVPMLLVQARK